MMDECRPLMNKSTFLKGLNIWIHTIIPMKGRRLINHEQKCFYAAMMKRVQGFVISLPGSTSLRGILAPPNASDLYSSHSGLRTG